MITLLKVLNHITDKIIHNTEIICRFGDPVTGVHTNRCGRMCFPAKNHMRAGTIIQQRIIDFDNVILRGIGIHFPKPAVNRVFVDVALSTELSIRLLLR